MAMQAELVGLPFFKSQMAKFLPKETRAVLSRLSVKTAAGIRTGLRRGAPRRTGTLRKAIVSKRERGTSDMVAASVYITKGGSAKNDGFYWHMVVFGTQHSRANDFITPVIQDFKSNYRAQTARELNTQVLKQLEKRAKRQRRKK